MINLSYNLSPNLKDSLQKIENLRAKILLTPLSPETELRLRWNTTVKRIYWSLVLHQNPLSKSDIIKLLSNTYQTKKRFNDEEKEVLEYKKGLDYINREWLVSSRNITSKVIINLHNISSQGTFKATEASLKQIFEYLQESSEHPVIQAAIAHIALLDLNGFSQGNGRISRLTTYLFLYKFGYDFKGLLCLDEYFKRDLVGYRENVEAVLRNNNLTLWLEYFAGAVVAQLEKALTEVLSEKYSLDLQKNFFELNDRQKEIMSLLDQPSVVISNKKVQKMFKVSQITASRDLSRLSTLGLLFTHGKGRSVYYTKI